MIRKNTQEEIENLKRVWAQNHKKLIYINACINPYKYGWKKYYIGEFSYNELITFLNSGDLFITLKRPNSKNIRDLTCTKEYAIIYR